MGWRRTTWGLPCARKRVGFAAPATSRSLALHASGRLAGDRRAPAMAFDPSGVLMVSQVAHPVHDGGDTGPVSVAQLLARYGQPQTAPGARAASAPLPPSSRAGRPNHARSRDGKFVALAGGGALLVGTLVVGATTMTLSGTGSDGQRRAEPTSRGPDHISVGGPAVAEVLRSDALRPSATLLPPPPGVDVSLPTPAKTRAPAKPRGAATRVAPAEPVERYRSGAAPARPGRRGQPGLPRRPHRGADSGRGCANRAGALQRSADRVPGADSARTATELACVAATAVAHPAASQC